jgi:hypothetical protein
MPVFVLKMKNKNNKNKKKLSFSIPNLTIDRDIRHIKNALLIFLFSTVVFYGVAVVAVNRIIISNIPEAAPIKYPPIYEAKIKKMIKDHPMEAMMPYISKQDKKTAIFLVAIAKKESNWGKYSPKKGKKECYNYWGYRGTYNQTASGYSCFDSEKQAIEVVGERIGELIDSGANTPQKMVVWKCGASCAGHSSGSVQKWIDDVAFYYQKIKG